MNPENTLMIKTALTVAKKVGASAVLLHVDPLDDLIFEEHVGTKKLDLFLLPRRKKLDGEAETHSLLQKSKGVITLPRISMTRVGLIKVATTLALSGDLIASGAKIVVAVGHADRSGIDLIQIIDTSKESEIITGKGLAKITENVRPELFQTVLNLAVELADKGREGKPIGTIFVLGDHDRVLQLSRQMIMNPLKGYEEEERHILSPSLKETIREDR